MTRRGFTMLEVVLAAAMGMLVLLAGSMLFVVMDRSDLSAKRRFESSSDFQRTRLVMQRAFSQLLMSDQQEPRKPRPEEEAAAGAKAGETPAAAAASRNQREPEGPPPPPRMILGVPETTAPISGGVAGYANSALQRFEVVVFSSPVPSQRAVGIDAWTRGGRSSSAPSSKSGSARSKDASSMPEKDAIKDVEPSPREDIELAEEEAEQPVRAFRGAFEFLPQGLREGETPDPTAPAKYQLWWIPMPPRRNPGEELDPAREAFVRANLERPYLLCSDIVAAGWRLFDDRERKTTATITWDRYLPAYVEFQIEKSDGMKAEWMFEVGWAKGPEVRRPKNADQKGVGKDASAKESGGGQPKQAPAPGPGGKVDK
ncbi:MAG: PulJ/GspJ family protein [Phycisphaerales bacterium]